jgi:flagellar basal-body rod modification protein FlgD
MGFNGVTGSIAANSGRAAEEQVASNQLGKDAFLRLLTTQLRQQDPLNPMDSQAFVAQLAQFSQLEQLEGVGSRLDTMLVGQASANQLQTASLVGREVLFKSDGVHLESGQPASFEVTLDGASDQTVALVADASGRVVRTLDLGARGDTTFPVTWDGLDERGEALPTGEYVITVSAKKDGADLNATTSVRALVTSIAFESQVPELVAGGRRVPLSDVLQISTPRSGA